MDANEHSVSRTGVLIAVAVRLYREGLALTLGADESIAVLGTAETVSDAIEAACRLCPDVALIDSSLEGALDLIRELRAECPETRVLTLALREDITSILSFAEAGADGFVTANSTMSELLSAIRSTRAGELLCSPRIAAQLLRHAARNSGPAPGAWTAALTGREQQVFSLLREGRTNKEIGVSLCISEATVKNHVHHVLEKLQVTTRAKAAAAGLKRTPPAPRSRHTG